MGEIGVRKPRYFRQKPSGCYWEPSRKVRAMGFIAEALGTDPVEAIRKARALNKRVAERIKEGVHLSPGEIEGTICWTIRKYKASRAWLKLADSTKRGYQQCLDRIEEWAGEEMVEAITRRAVKAWQHSMEETAPYFAAATLRVFRVVMKAAKNEGRKVDLEEFSELDLQTAGGDGEPWADWEISAYLDEAKRQGRQSMALALMLGVCLGQREGDIIRMARSQYDPATGTVELRQRKTKRPLRVPVLEELRREIRLTPVRSPLLVVTEAKGKPYKARYLARLHREICQAAGIPDERKFMHLRHTAATRLGEAGCSEDFIRSVTGHTSDAIRRYVKPNDTMARGAITKLIEHRNRRLETGTATEKQK